MALPTKGRVIIDTTAGEIDIELWSKVVFQWNIDSWHFQLKKGDFVLGNTQSMPQFPRVGYGGFVSFSRNSWFISLKKRMLSFFCWLGYYDGVIFHRSVVYQFAWKSFDGHCFTLLSYRIVPRFLVQTGDKTGTGAGGESFYGGSLCLLCPAWTLQLFQFFSEPFEDEIHPRLRFPHRGLVAMANNGTKNSNDSQFFITLGNVFF